MVEPVVCKLGELKMRHGEFAFAPGDASEFTVPRGKDAKIGFTYDYEEASTSKERARLALSLFVNEFPIKQEVKIGDIPMVPDAEVGFISGTRKLPPGEHEGRFLIEADYGASSWFGRVLGKSKTFRHEGTFIVRVR